MREAPGTGLLAEPPPQDHMVQFYAADEAALLDNVARYAREGLRRDEGVLVVATPEHNDAVDERLADVRGARRRVLFADAEAIAAVLRDGDPLPFRTMLEDAIGALREAGADGVRVYGEAVGVLWSTEDRERALLAEQVAEPLLERHEATVFCGYPIDVFGEDFELQQVDPLLSAHSRLLPTGPSRSLERAVDRAMHEILGRKAEGLRFLIRANFRPAWGAVPRAEATILWIRNNLPGSAGTIMERAREHYRAAAIA